MRVICTIFTVVAAGLPTFRRAESRYIPDMRHGLWRSLSALVSGTAFAVSVAGPVQWDPCPMHGVAVQAAPVQTPPDMPMPAGAHHALAAHTHSGHGAPDSHHAGHQCTCPGGCCGTTPAALLTPALHTPRALYVATAARIAHPTDTVDLASSPQIALPFAHGPPAFLVTPQDTLRSTT